MLPDPAPAVRLGIGCSRLAAGSFSGLETRLIHAALDEGVRYFDVAPQYGMGTAEDVLGGALAGRRNEVVIATKVGIPRGEVSRSKLMARALLAPVRRFLPKRPGGANPALRPATNFAPQYVRETLADSLRRLRTDRIDAYLLHMVAPSQVTDELVEVLTGARQAGTVGRLGLATTKADADAISVRYPGIFSVLQYHWDFALPSPAAEAGVSHNLHGAVSATLEPLLELLNGDAALRREVSNTVGQDLAQLDILPALIVAGLVSLNPGGFGLVSSRDIARTRANIRAARSPEMQQSGARLYDLMHDRLAARKPARW